MAYVIQLITYANYTKKILKMIVYCSYLIVLHNIHIYPASYCRHSSSSAL